MEEALLSYSQERKPEGDALAALLGLQGSRGKSNESSPPARRRRFLTLRTAVVGLLRNAKKVVLRGLQPGNRRYWDQQTLMSQTLMPFAEIEQMGKKPSK